MSCHTWAYKAVEQKELDTVKSDWLLKLRSNCEYVPDGSDINKFVDNMMNIYKRIYQDYENDSECKKLATDRKYVEKHLLKMTKRINSLIKNISDCTTPEELKKYYNEFDHFDISPDYKIYKEKLYQEIDTDNPIRVYGYPEEKFDDPEKFIAWIKEHESSDDYKAIRYKGSYDDFEEGCTEGNMKAIRDFWEKNNGLVLVEFG